MKSPLACRCLACGYAPERPVLCDLEFSLEPGTVTALLGPNGSGKSTLLKTLSGTLAPLDGEAWLGDRSLSRLPPQELARQVAFVPQREETPYAFTVREVVTMGRLARSEALFDTVEDRRMADQALRQMDCEAFADRSTIEISGGEHQRMLLARALAQDTPILLLDEPTAHLDLTHQIQLVKRLRKLAAEGKAILLALHDLNLVAALADRVLLLDQGRLILDALPEDALAGPAIDQVFGVHFERVRSSAGRLWLHPALGSSD